MRRLFSTFARGAPGAGLLLMRGVAGSALTLHGIVALAGTCEPACIAFHIACAAVGVLLIAGLWTPIVGALAAIGAGLHALFIPPEAGFYGLLAALAAALVLLGPGAWSVDARLFGWRRVEIRNGSGPDPGKRHDAPL